MDNAGQIKGTLLSVLKPLRRANWTVVLFCLFTAAIFWFFNALNKVYTARINYPMAMAINTDSLVFVTRPPATIPINVTGGGWQLLKRTISLNNHPIVITPENPVKTTFFTAANLLPEVSDQMTDLNINHIAIDTIFFRIEPKAMRTLAIELDSAKINLKENFYITSPIEFGPDSVRFFGPKSLVDRLPNVFVVSLSDRNIDDRYNAQLSLDLFLPALVRKDPEDIYVRFDVEEFIPQKSTVTIGKVNFPYEGKINLAQNTIEVQYKVQRSLRSKVKPDDIILVADLESIQKQDSTIDVVVMDLPDYIRDVTFSPGKVRVSYE
ncbi:MAG: hypothetical protein U5K79_19885 [Cyclobacteriaceae bacterium]|nr:hypothetical protein [Cyclobacteriaceae bacterium]